MVKLTTKADGLFWYAHGGSSSDCSVIGSNINEIAKVFIQIMIGATK